MTDTVPVAPRKPWAAALLTLLLPGLGHLYAGAPRRAVAAWALTTAAGILAILSIAAFPSRTSALAIWPIILGAEAAVITDAVRTARRASLTFVPQAYNRWYVYVCLPLIVGLVWNTPVLSYMRTHVLQAFRIPTSAMAPTILAGDWVFVTPLHDSVRRGDIFVYRSMKNQYIKRVVALGGDTVSMRADTLFVNSTRVSEPYIAPPSADDHPPESADFDWQREALAPGVDPGQYRPTISTWGPLVVRHDTYFILGDNRHQSADSRYIGPIPEEMVTARPLIVYLSRDPETGSIRWSRIGRNVAR